MRLRKDDQVVVITGKDRGKKGRVMKVTPTDNTVLVEKINYRKVAQRRTQTNPQGGVVQMEGDLQISNVKLICPRCNKPTRVGYTILADKSKQRGCKRCHEVLGG